MNSLSWPICKKPQVYAFVVIEAPDSNGARIGRETEEEPVSSRPEKWSHEVPKTKPKFRFQQKKLKCQTDRFVEETKTNAYYTKLLISNLSF